MKIVRGANIEFTPASHEDPKSPGSLKKVLFARADMVDGRAQMVNWALLPAGKAFNLHYHDTLQEVFVMIRGTVTIEVNGTTEVLSAGDAVRIDEGERHLMRNEGSEDAEYIVFGITRDDSGKTVVVRNTSGR